MFYGKITNLGPQKKNEQRVLGNVLLPNFRATLVYLYCVRTVCYVFSLASRSRSYFKGNLQK